MTGWCPRHDRVFTSRSRMCPECGAKLVAIPAERPKTKTLRDRIIDETRRGLPPTPHDEEPHRDQQPELAPAEMIQEAGPGIPRQVVLRTGWLAIAVVIAIGVAFLAGIAFPEGSPAPPLAVPTQVRTNLSIGEQQHGAGVVLRLESFEQRGRRVVMRISVLSPDDFDIGRIRGLHAVFFSQADIELAETGLAVRTTPSGFIADGEILSRADVPVSGVHINGIELAIERNSAITVDLSKVWPASAANQPRAVAVRQVIDEDGPRRLVLTGMVGWVDRLQFNITAEEPRSGWSYGEEFSLIVSTGAIGGHVSHGGGGSIIVEYQDVPSDERRVELSLNIQSLFIEGGWSWRFIPPGN